MFFYAGQSGAYQCQETNIGFEDAAVQAGYRKADRFIQADLDGTVVTLPVVDGVFYAPDYPGEEESEEAQEDDLFYDSFTGWVTENDLETLGYEAPSMPLAPLSQWKMGPITSHFSETGKRHVRSFQR